MENMHEMCISDVNKNGGLEQLWLIFGFILMWSSMQRMSGNLLDNKLYVLPCDKFKNK